VLAEVLRADRLETITSIICSNSIARAFLSSELNAKPAWVALRKRVEGFMDCFAFSISNAPLQKDPNSGFSGSWLDNSNNFRSIIR
jgi:hypothetical protein